jgi:hypothetical protein
LSQTDPPSRAESALWLGLVEDIANRA